MAIITYDQPETYQLAYNDNVYVFRSSQPTPTKRFKVSVLPSNSFIPVATVRIYPTPSEFGGDHRAFVDVSRILQSKLGHDISIPTANHLGFLPNTNSHFEYALLIQEEDINSDGAYEVEGLGEFYDIKSVWNGVQNNIDWLDFTPSDYLMNTGVGTHKWLTDGPTSTNYRDINTGQSASLYFIGTEDNAPNGYYLTTYSDYNAQGTQLSNILVSNPYASAMSAGYTKRFLRVPVGTYDIPLTNPTQYSSGSPATVLNNVKSYSIKMWDTSFPISETVTFNVDRNCSKYTPVRLHWMNRLGGFDSFNFDLKSEEATGVKRKQYDQQPHTFTGTAWNYSKASRGRTQYDTQLTKKIKVNTNYLTEGESDWMESLFTSPEVYQELGNELIAVSINGKSIKKQTSLNDKLMQYSFDLEYAIKNMRQRG
tara:strand:- start:3669 stop:4943 length:1275 start_codon:yes stop_codon:yes gene_type:complete